MNLIKNIKIDLWRAFGSKMFFIGVLCTVGILYLNISWDNLANPNVIYIVAGIPWGSQVQTIFICGAIPYATAYLSDYNSGYIRPLVIRSNLQNYLRSKVFATSLSGLSAIFLGKLLFALTLWTTYPLVTEYTSMDPIGIDILYSISPWAYLLADALLYALAGAGFAAMALLVSSLTHNAFVTIMSPLVLFFMISSLEQIFNVPQGIELNGLLMGYIKVYADSWLFTLIHILAVWIITTIIVGKLFIWHAERRFYHG